VTTTPTNNPADPTDRPVPAAPASQPTPAAERAGQPTAPERPDLEGLKIVLSTDTEAQTDDPVINPNNS